MNPFKFNMKALTALLFISLVVIISGVSFLVMLFFGMYGLSRLLIYFHLAEFTYNQSFFDNTMYYGSYLLAGYFLLVVIEWIMDQMKKRYDEVPYFHGWYFHIITIFISTLVFYLGVHMNYEYIRINFFVVLGIIAILYFLTETFYPDPEDMNDK